MITSLNYRLIVIKMSINSKCRLCQWHRRHLNYMKNVMPTTFAPQTKPKIVRQNTTCVSKDDKQLINKNQLIKFLNRRGLLKEVFTDKRGFSVDLESFLNQGPQAIYAGFDPTSNSLHFGNLLILITLIHFARFGHQPVIIIGDATASIGDPSGRTMERPLLDQRTIEKNCDGISSDINKIFANYRKYFWKQKSSKYGHYLSEGSSNVEFKEPIVLRNSLWYSKMAVIEFMSTIGRKVRLSEMMSRSVVEERAKSIMIERKNEDGSKEMVEIHGRGMSFAEFSYQAFQAYDWFILKHRYNCSIQLGGSDQMGNIVTGYDVITRGWTPKQFAADPIFGLTVPLLTNEEGVKYGKSETGSNVWLSDRKMSPFDFYQWFVRLSDTEVAKFLKIFTFYSDEEIESILNRFLKSKESRIAQEKLAEHVTLLVHGASGVESAIQATKALYKNDLTALGKMTHQEMKQIFGESAHFFEFYLPKGSFDEDDVSDLSSSQINPILEYVDDIDPVSKRLDSKVSEKIKSREIEHDRPTILELVMKVKGFTSMKEATNTIRNGGVSINFNVVKDPNRTLNDEMDILENDITLIRIGKRRYYIIKWR